MSIRVKDMVAKVTEWKGTMAVRMRTVQHYSEIVQRILQPPHRIPMLSPRRQQIHMLKTTTNMLEWVDPTQTQSLPMEAALHPLREGVMVA